VKPDPRKLKEITEPDNKIAAHGQLLYELPSGLADGQ